GHTGRVVGHGGDGAGDVRAVVAQVVHARHGGEVLLEDDFAVQIRVARVDTAIQHGDIDAVALCHVPRGTRLNLRKPPLVAQHRIVDSHGRVRNAVWIG